ncbi:MAG: transcription elongation factor GreA [Oscillospiraceae bacterium]|nr:transcription elongation factor GreA [Oscillospiraceae bacterium]
MNKPYKLTKERYDELKKELVHLKTVREKEVAEQIKEARSFGDLSENCEYDEAKNEQGRLFSRIAEVEAILAAAVIIEAAPEGVDVIDTGCRVKVKSLDDGEEESYFLVGTLEVNPLEGRISDESPLGKELIGKRAGDVITLQSPEGKQLSFEILEIGVP